MITSDGAAAHRLLAPSSHVDKVYVASLDGKVGKNKVAAFENGVFLGDFTAMSAKLEAMGELLARVTIREGKFHQVKRTSAACGLKVTTLKRVAFGVIKLPEDLSEGQARPLTEREIEVLGIAR